MTDAVIRPIGAAQCLPLRQAVLWPQSGLAERALAEDAEGRHWGGWMADRLVCVASFFILPGAQARLRKFATLPARQGQGVGSAVLRAGCQALADDGVHTLWFDARVSAQAFYARRGFRPQGALFSRQGVDYQRMSGPLPLAG